MLHIRYNIHYFTDGCFIVIIAGKGKRIIIVQIDNINGFVERDLKYFEFAAVSLFHCFTNFFKRVCLGSSEGQQITKGIKLMKFELFCYTE